MENKFNKYKKYPDHSGLTINNRKQDHIFEQVLNFENKVHRLNFKEELKNNILSDIEILKDLVVHDRVDAILSLMDLMRHKVQNVLNQSFFPSMKIQILMNDLIDLQQSVFYVIEIKEVKVAYQYNKDDNTLLDYDSKIKENFQIIEEDNIDIGEIVIPEKSTITGETTITVLECKPVINDINSVNINLLFMIQEKFIIKTPSGRNIPLEFSYRIKKMLLFDEIKQDEINTILEGGYIVIEYLDVSHEVILNPNSPGKEHARIDERLIIDICLKLV